MLNSIVTIVCIALIAFILFWFFKKPENLDKRPSKKTATKRFEWKSWGGYTPELIILKKSVPARIVFDRKDPSPCLDQNCFSRFLVYMRTCQWVKSM